MDWLTYGTLILQAIIAFPVLWFLAYVIGHAFSAGSGVALKTTVKQFLLMHKKDERDIL